MNYPTPQSANFQAFYGGGTGTTTNTPKDWVKPQGASMVRMLLIGAGGGGGGANSAGGGGSGAVTQWIGPAMFIPDVLRINVGSGGAGALGGGNGGLGGSTTVDYQAKDGTGYTLLTASGGSGGNGSTGGAGGSAMTNNYFGASGIFKSVAGQNGANSGSNVTASSTTFLSGGAAGSPTGNDAGLSVLSKYGYPELSGGATSNNGQSGYFLLQPIMVGYGGSGGGGQPAASTDGFRGGNGGIGCGGGGAGRSITSSAYNGNGGRGGDGAVFIWSW